MLKNLRNIALIFILAGLTFTLSACNSSSSFVEGDPYFYTMYISPDDAGDTYDIKFYTVDPFKKKVVTSSKAETEEIESDETIQEYDLEEYEEKDNLISFKYNGITERLEKKTDTLWVSSKTGLEYTINKNE